MATGFAYDQRMLIHDVGSAHPEKPQRIKAIVDRLEASAVLEQLQPIKPKTDVMDDIARLHRKHYIERFKSACERGIATLDTPDCPISSGSFEAAVVAVGATIATCRAVAEKHVENGFCDIRPPGHHSLPDRAMGFCFFNNVAIAARHLQHEYDIERIFILDWDVHHGNGTQEAFWNDETVFYCSLHAEPPYTYPGSGYKSEIGAGRGKGFTLNIPLPHNTTDRLFMQLCREQAFPAMRRFKPQFILVSAGYDGHKDDLLVPTVQLSTDCYDRLSVELVDLAHQLCDGRLVVVLEGGYDLPSLSRGVQGLILAMKGQSPHA